MDHGAVSDEITIAQVCREMHWTLQQYGDQPHWFVELIVGMMIVETRDAERKRKKTKG